jgi:hypothetical protein
MAYRHYFAAEKLIKVTSFKALAYDLYFARLELENTDQKAIVAPKYLFWDTIKPRWKLASARSEILVGISGVHVRKVTAMTLRLSLTEIKLNIQRT